jgi:hypothetical protein
MPLTRRRECNVFRWSASGGLDQAAFIFKEDSTHATSNRRLTRERGPPYCAKNISVST